MLTRSTWRAMSGESGQTLIMGLMLLILLLGFAAIVVDIGLFLHRRANIQQVMDAAALAGAQELPEDAALAEEIARAWVVRNGLPEDAIKEIRFECRAANPLHCEPSGYDTILISGETQAPVVLMPVLQLIGTSESCWLSEGCPVSAMAAACRGECTAALRPVDIVLILDRTGSMSDDDMDNAKDGALALLRALDPELQHVALGVLGPSVSWDDPCPSEEPGIWLPVRLSGDYLTPDGELNNQSRLVSVIECLQTSAVGTDLGDPVADATEHILANGRVNVDQVIVLLTDGAANRPLSTNPCEFAANQADEAKAAGIEFYAIGFGVGEPDPDGGDLCGRDSGSWKGRSAEELVRYMATDDEHVFIEPKTSDLREVFEEIALHIAAGSRLVE